MSESQKMDRRPFVRNHRLPRWLHRFCNASITALLFATTVLLLWPNLTVGIGGAILSFVVMLFVNPERLSFVEGVAGEVGYVDLDGANKP
jgi:hypothetical protein